MRCNMTINKSSAAIFEERINDLINCHLILTDRAISLLLKCIASTPEFTTVLTNTFKEVSYADEFEHSRVYFVKDNKTHVKFVPPTDKNRIFTLVVCLLTEFDTGRRNLLTFLQEYFAGGTDAESYQRFCQTVLRPFKRAGELILKSHNPLSTNVSDETTAQRLFASARIDSPQEKLNAIIKEIDNFKQNVSVAANLDISQKEECFVLATALSNALIAKNAILAKQFWIGLKNTVIANNATQIMPHTVRQLLAEARLI